MHSRHQYTFELPTSYSLFSCIRQNLPSQVKILLYPFFTITAFLKNLSLPHLPSFKSQQNSNPISLQKSYSHSSHISNQAEPLPLSLNKKAYQQPPIFIFIQHLQHMYCLACCFFVNSIIPNGTCLCLFIS